MKSKAGILFISLLILFIFLLVFPALSIFSTSNATNSNLLVNFSNNRLTVKSQKSMLIDILREISEKTGVVFIVKARIDDPIDMDFEALDLEKGIKRLTRGLSCAFQYGPQGKNLTSHSLLSVHIFSSDGTYAGQEEMTIQAASFSGDADQADDIFNFFDLAQTDPQALSLLLDTLEYDTGSNRRLVAVQLLGFFDDSRAKSALIAAIKDRDKEMREAALQSLGNIAVSDDAIYFVQALEDEDNDVRATAVEKLGSLFGETALPQLISASRDSSPKVREAALGVLEFLEGSQVQDDDPDNRS